MDPEAPERESAKTGSAIAEWVHAAEKERLTVWLGSAESDEVTYAVSHLEPEVREQLLALLDDEDAADLLMLLPASQATEALEALPADTAARIVHELASDEQADLISGLDNAEQVLAELDPAEASEIRSLSAYDADSAGGLMVTEYLAFRTGDTVADVVAALQDVADEQRDYDVQYLYVLGPDRALVGVLRLRDLLMSPRSRAVERIMIRDPLSVSVDDDLEALRRFFLAHDFIGVPVVDPERGLVGVVHKTAVGEALADQSGADYSKAQGIIGGDELRSMPLLLRSRRRLSWLSLNVLLNVLAASVIAAYQETLETVIALAVFLPIISDMSGCSGNQAVAVSMRELALSVVRPRDAWRVLSKEVAVGLLNGLALGILIGIVAWVWKRNIALSLVVGCSLMANTVLAVAIGGTVPLLLKAVRRDPALASGPILTTLTDMCGFFLVLSLASLALERLAG